MLKDGTIYYTTSNGVYEIGTSGKSVQVAGGGNLGPGQWRNGLPATESAIQPHGLVGVSASKFYFTTVDNELDIVQNGEMSEYQAENSNFFNGEMTSAQNGTIYADLRLVDVQDDWIDIYASSDFRPRFGDLRRAERRRDRAERGLLRILHESVIARHRGVFVMSAAGKYFAFWSLGRIERSRLGPLTSTPTSPQP